MSLQCYAQPLYAAGLDEAILGAMNPTDPEEDGKKITSLLQNGAHAMLAQEDTKAKDGEAFAEEVLTAPRVLSAVQSRQLLRCGAGHYHELAT